jgi:integrase
MAKRTTVPEGKQRKRVGDGIYLKRSGKYLATFRDPGRKQHWKEFATKAEAVRWRAQGRLDPRKVVGGNRKLREVWTEMMQYRTDLKLNTRSLWEYEWRAHIEPHLGNWPVGRISVREVKAYLHELEGRGVGAATRHKCRSILHRLLEWALENEEIHVNPVDAPGTRVKLPQRRRARILTSTEVARAVSAAGDVGCLSDSLAMESLFSLGLRPGEMAGLQVNDVDVARREIVIRRTVVENGGRVVVQDATKTDRYRLLPIPKDLPLWSRLIEYIQSRGAIGAVPLFTSPEGGVIRLNNWRRRVWAKTMLTAKIVDPPTPHSGRRTTASLLSEAGVPLPAIQAILGHSTARQTGEYVDVPRDRMEEALGRLGALYGDGGND